LAFKLNLVNKRLSKIDERNVRVAKNKLAGYIEKHCEANNLRSEKIKVGKIDIRYFCVGQGDPLIIVHGGGGSGSAWLQNAIELSNYYTVYIPDLPGFGRSKSISEDFDLLEYVSFLEDFSSSLGLKDFHLAGHSLGGGIALHYALMFPHKVRRLVLISSLCLGKEIALWPRILSNAKIYRFLKNIIVSLLCAIKSLWSIFNKPFTFEHPRFLLRMSVGQCVMTFKGQTAVLLNCLSKLLMPTLLIWGARDSIVPARHAYAAARLIPDCQVHIFEKCGHSAYRRKVPEFSKLLVRFLR